MRKLFKVLEFVFIGIPIYFVAIALYDAELRIFYPGEIEALEKKLKGNNL